MASILFSKHLETVNWSEWTLQTTQDTSGRVFLQLKKFDLKNTLLNIIGLGEKNPQLLGIFEYIRACLKIYDFSVLNIRKTTKNVLDHLQPQDLHSPLLKKNIQVINQKIIQDAYEKLEVINKQPSSLLDSSVKEIPPPSFNSTTTSSSKSLKSLKESEISTLTPLPHQAVTSPSLSKKHSSSSFNKQQPPTSKRSLPPSENKKTPSPQKTVGGTLKIVALIFAGILLGKKAYDTFSSSPIDNDEASTFSFPDVNKTSPFNTYLNKSYDLTQFSPFSRNGILVPRNSFDSEEISNYYSSFQNDENTFLHEEEPLFSHPQESAFLNNNDPCFASNNDSHELPPFSNTTSLTANSTAPIQEISNDSIPLNSHEISPVENASLYEEEPSFAYSKALWNPHLSLPSIKQKNFIEQPQEIAPLNFDTLHSKEAEPNQCLASNNDSNRLSSPFSNTTSLTARSIVPIQEISNDSISLNPHEIESAKENHVSTLNRPHLQEEIPSPKRNILFLGTLITVIGLPLIYVIGKNFEKLTHLLKSSYIKHIVGTNRRGLDNLENTCFINSSLQTFILQPSSGNKTIEALLNKTIKPRKSEDAKGNPVFESNEDVNIRQELQQNLKNLRDEWKKGIKNNPNIPLLLEKTIKSQIFSNSDIQIGRQGDPDEVISIILGALPYETLSHATLYNGSRLQHQEKVRFQRNKEHSPSWIKINANFPTTLQQCIDNQFAENDIEVKWEENGENVPAKKTLLLNVPKKEIPNTLGIHLGKYLDPNTRITNILHPFHIDIHKGLNNYKRPTKVSYQVDRIIHREVNIFIKTLNLFCKIFCCGGSYINKSHYVTYKKLSNDKWVRLSDNEKATVVSSKEIKAKVETGAVVISCSKIS